MSKIFCLAVILSLVSIISAATTKKPIPACAKCVNKAAGLIGASGAGTVTPTVKAVANTAAGCKRINVVCATPADATRSSMEFNRSIGGPYEGKTVIATLTCGGNLKWHYTKAEKVIVVNSVGCMYV